MPTVSVNGIDINYSLEGDGAQTIVLVNGLADDLNTWELQMADLLAAGYRVLRFDNRGVGLSSTPPGPYTSRLLADDAKALVDHLELSGFHLMGVSMGGMIAQEYALAYPDDLATVTLACTYAAPGPFCSRMFSMWHDMAPTTGVPFIMRDVLLWASRCRSSKNIPRTSSLRRGARGDDDVHRRLPRPARGHSHPRHHDRLGTLSVPTLVLAGEEDILIPVRLSRQLHALVPGAEWATTTGGHACMWEHPAAFNKTYLDYLSRH